MFSPPLLPRTLEAAKRDLASAKPEVRASAIRDLVRHASSEASVRKDAVTAFARMLSEDVSPPVRAEAAVALADLDGHEAHAALLVAIEDESAHVREMALAALGEIGDERAAPRLRRALADDRPEVRYQALIAFTRVRKDAPDDVADALLAALDDGDDAIRHIALRIAEEWITAKRPLPVRALAERARRLLDDPSPDVALAAAIVLAETGDAAGRAHVLRVVMADRIVPGAVTPGREDERAAVELAGALGLREAIPALERRAYGLGRFVRDTCAWHAKIALARMDHPRAIAEFRRDLASKNRETREAAVVAVGRARVRALAADVAALAPGSVDATLLDEARRMLSEITPMAAPEPERPERTEEGSR
ncbi:MAG: HEAT repeat domain-containing protein [Polyangiaceae bacterium]